MGRLVGKSLIMLIDFTYEDMGVQYPKIRLEEEGATIIVAGSHPAGTKYTGKFGYPTPSTATIAEVDVAACDGIIVPGGFAPDYMRRNEPMKAAVVAMLAAGKPIA